LDRRLQLIISEITQNHSTRLHMPELAAKVNLTVRRVEQLFKEGTGMTCVAFRRRLRMRLAEKLLVKSRKPVDEITSAIGYKAAAHFCRAFKKFNGCTATRFRRRSSRTKRAK